MVSHHRIGSANRAAALLLANCQFQIELEAGKIHYDVYCLRLHDYAYTNIKDSGYSLYHVYIATAFSRQSKRRFELKVF